MREFTGKGVYGAVAVGEIEVFKRQEVSVRRVHVTDTAGEKERVLAAKGTSMQQLQEIWEKAVKEVGEANAQIF